MGEDNKRKRTEEVASCILDTIRDEVRKREVPEDTFLSLLDVTMDALELAKVHLILGVGLIAVESLKDKMVDHGRDQ